MKNKSKPTNSWMNLLALFIPVLIMVLFSVVMNSLSVYVTKAQETNYTTGVWFLLPILDLVFVLGCLWVLARYRSTPGNPAIHTIMIIIGLCMLIVPLVPPIAIHLDLPWNVPYLQVTGAFLTLLPISRRLLM
jgi:hypothetical protein